MNLFGHGYLACCLQNCDNNYVRDCRKDGLGRDLVAVMAMHLGGTIKECCCERGVSVLMLLLLLQVYNIGKFLLPLKYCAPPRVFGWGQFIKVHCQHFFSRKTRLFAIYCSLNLYKLGDSVYCRGNFDYYL